MSLVYYRFEYLSLFYSAYIYLLVNKIYLLQYLISKFLLYENVKMHVLIAEETLLFPTYFCYCFPRVKARCCCRGTKGHMNISDQKYFKGMKPGHSLP